MTTVQTPAATSARNAGAPLDRPSDPITVATIAGGHFVHDAFSSFLSPLLPLIIDKLSLSLTLAGSLSALQSFPSIVNPLLGMIGDRVSLRWLAVIAPTTTAITMSLIGVAPTYTLLAILLLVAGISNACWHTPTPVLVARSAGRRVGLGMSVLMMGGEMARTLGPLIVVGAVSLWGLEGIWRLIPFGVCASAVLLWRTRNLETRPSIRTGGSWAQTWIELRRVLLPIAGIILTRTFVSATLSTYLPTLLTREGDSLLQAGGALSVLMLAGAIGSLVTGTVSDRFGRRLVLSTVLILSPLCMVVFLNVHGWIMLPVLFVLGFMANSTSPVLLALVQENGRDHPATANGMYMALEFVGGSLITVVVGVIADALGLRTAFGICAGIAIFAALFVFMLPQQKKA
ncbi:MAG: MFS transporter [Chloroflexi bacterium]|nr:MFS transporter [Chloroflexota bacterium]MCL5273563.1 MFS transporter [Chloroflexota bacterium]